MSLFIPLLIASIAYASSVITETKRAKDRAWEISDKFETGMVDLLVKKYSDKPCELKRAISIVYDKEDWLWLNKLKNDLNRRASKCGT